MSLEVKRVASVDPPRLVWTLLVMDLQNNDIGLKTCFSLRLWIDIIWEVFYCLKPLKTRWNKVTNLRNNFGAENG